MLSPCIVTTSTAGLITAPNSTTSEEDTARSTNDNISLEIEQQPVTRSESESRLRRYFCLDVVFNLSNMVIPELKISVL